MISDQCFTAEWQIRKRAELGGCDPQLLEKTIHVFSLVDALAGRGLEFIFKGGTSLMLRLPRIRRLSIDADICCLELAEKLDALLTQISREHPFTGMAEDDRSSDRLPSRRHFKFFYTPLDAKNIAPWVLLDVVHEKNVYPHFERVPLQTPLVDCDGTAMVPNIEGLLGDKLTAFAPNTVGVPLNERTTMQFMKHVFDIGELFNIARDIVAIRMAHERVFAVENTYRGGKFTVAQALQDTFDSAFRIAQIGLATAPKDGLCQLLDAGCKQINSHLIGMKFRRGEMQIAAAKAALLSSALLGDALPVFDDLRYDTTKLARLKEVKFDSTHAPLGKLKAVPEAMWLWAEALRLHTHQRRKT